MKKNVLAVALALMAGIGAYAEKNTITSPDGKLNVVVEDRDGKLYYSIDYAGKRMMEEYVPESRLSTSLEMTM